MQEEQIKRIVAEIISRLAPLMGANGEKGSWIAVFTGASVGIRPAAEQVRGLVYDGFRIKYSLSGAAEHIYQPLLMNEWLGLPHITPVREDKWLADLKEADGLVVPLLSVNTLSKTALLIADNLPTNLILHALFMGKPVVFARDGADPKSAGRSELGFDQGAGALSRALEERFQAAISYGVKVTGVHQLRAVCGSLLGKKSPGPPVVSKPAPVEAAPVTGVVTTIEVRNAGPGGTIRMAPGAVITPLARETAGRTGVRILMSN